MIAVLVVGSSLIQFGPTAIDVLRPHLRPRISNHHLHMIRSMKRYKYLLEISCERRL